MAFEQTPPGCEGWEEMYPHYVRFSEDRRDFDEGRFWFQDGMHWPEPIYPLDALVVDCCAVALSQASARLFAVPASLGIEYRILNGYAYISANSITDEKTIERRAELFAKRGGYYYEHWEELYAGWLRRVQGATSELEALVVPELRELEDETVVTNGRGWGSSHALLVAYDRLLEGLDRVLQYHFELLNLGYGAYLDFYELCRQAFPDIRDKTLATMVSGIEVVLLRPDEELRSLARLALELGVGEAVKAAGGEEGLRAALAPGEAGERWLAVFEDAKDPWFYVSYGNGLSSNHRSWIDDTTLPIAMIGSYIERLEAGEDVSRPRDAVVGERDRISEEYRSLLPDETRPAFDERLALARTVFPYVENHNFFIDHRYLTLFWNKVREFGDLLSRHAFLDDRDDVFYLRHDEVRSALAELRLSWSAGGVAPSRGPGYWPPVVARRKSILDAMRRWAAPPTLGRVPEKITDPVTIMLWGMTAERAREALGSPDEDEDVRVLRGVAASGGVAEGLARVILHHDQLGRLEAGEILVAPSTATSWTPVFGTIAAAVSDTGGVMCHAAIVAREYGLPAVVGAAKATTVIKTGDRVRVDGVSGIVTILDNGV